MMNTGGIPPDAVEQALRNSRDRCQTCRQRFTQGEYRVAHRILKNKSLYDPSNVLVLCWNCHKTIEAYKQYLNLLYAKEK